MRIKLNFDAYKDKVKACWIGKNIGGTMGTPYEGVREMLDIKGFSTPKNVVLPNDDLDLQLVWLHALEQVGPWNIDAATLGEFWLNFIPPNWNEYGIGKANMRRGLTPPLSGDYDNNWRDSNGAWIRTEIWASVAPAAPELAARYAVEDAKVDHGAGEGTFAAAFVAAMQSAAFVIDDIFECIRLGLCAIPENCRMAQSIKLVLECYEKKISWQEARNAVFEANSDIGNGWFEAPTNVSYAVLGMLYGEGDFKKSMIIAINCGDDTDCTGATVGATLGILYGMAGIPEDWAEHIGDDIVTISISRGQDAKQLPNTCTALTERVTALAPIVLYSFSKSANNAFHKRREPLFVEFSENAELPEGAIKLIETRLLRESRGELAKLADYTARFEEKFIRADITLSGAPEISANGELGVHIEFRNNRAYENIQQALKLSWILPDGFTVSGKTAALLQRYDDHNEPVATVDAVIKAGDFVSSENRIVLEVTVPGRHTALYAPLILFGC